MSGSKKYIVYSILIGLFLTAISGFIGIKCALAEPGGVSEGWRGLPIPYYQCGVWGDSVQYAIRCAQGMHEPMSSCLWVNFLHILILLINVLFWSLISYWLIKFYERHR